MAGGCSRLYNRKTGGGCINTPAGVLRPQEARQGVVACPGMITSATAENALYSDNFTDEDDGWRKYFDEKSVIDWFFTDRIAFSIYFSSSSLERGSGKTLLEYEAVKR